MDALTLSIELPATPEDLYDAWLDGERHTAFTGAEATIDAVVGGRHTAWDEYISGTIRALEPGRRIVQSWRTSEFPDDAPDSQLELVFEPCGAGTLLTLVHTEIPEGQGAKYEQGWREFYFDPLAAYFGG